MIPEELRKVRGGVIGCLTPKEIIIDVAERPELGAVGDNKVGIKVPAGKFVYAAYIKNVADDLAGAGAKLGVKVGTAVLAVQALADVKGKGKAAQVAAPAFVTADTDVTLTIDTAAVTAGKLAVGVIYG